MIFSLGLLNWNRLKCLRHKIILFGYRNQTCNKGYIIEGHENRRLIDLIKLIINIEFVFFNLFI